MARDVFEEDPFEAGTKFANDPGDVGPEVALVVGTLALSGLAERLTWVSGHEGIEGPGEWLGVECGNVIPDRGGGEVSGALCRDKG